MKRTFLPFEAGKAVWGREQQCGIIQCVHPAIISKGILHRLSGKFYISYIVIIKSSNRYKKYRLQATVKVPFS